MISLDPRTKVILLLITSAFSALIPNGTYTVIWIALVAIIGGLLGEVVRALRAAVVFAALWLFMVFVLPTLSGVLHTSLLVWLGLVFKCYPCCMIAGIMIATTQIGEFMAAMAKWRVPRSVVIPIAIMFRYFPTVKEDWNHIKDAMALRGIGLAPWQFMKNPEAVIDALYLPVLVTASKTVDELSASAITRGIENPRMRSSRLEIRMKIMDYVVIAVFAGALIVGLILSAGVKIWI